MFKEFETELMSIISRDPIEKIAHMPTNDIAKSMELIYNIKFENIEKVYTENIDKVVRMVVLYDSHDVTSQINQDVLPINGKIYHITLIPKYLLDTDENNAITMCRSIIKYVSIRLALIVNDYSGITSKVKDNTFDLVCLQAIPIITVAVMRQLYSGQGLSKIIYMTLCDALATYKTLSSEQGINTILNIFDEGLGVSELVDNGFICTIPCDDKNYPGIWCVNKENIDKDDENVEE